MGPNKQLRMMLDPVLVYIKQLFMLDVLLLLFWLVTSQPFVNFMPLFLQVNSLVLAPDGHCRHASAPETGYLVPPISLLVDE